VSDLRLPFLGAVAWASALAGFWRPWWVMVGAAVVIACWVLVRRPGAVQVAWLLLAVTAACGAAVRVDAVRGGPVAALAHDQAAVVAVVELTSDPSLRHGRFGDYVIARADVTQIRGRGRWWQLGTPVQLLGPQSMGQHHYGDVVLLTGRLSPAEDASIAARIRVLGDVSAVGHQGMWSWGTPVRVAVRNSVAGQPVEPRSLLPALVVGDDSGMPARLVDDFRTCGLTHLVAVSGTNLTLMLAFLMLLARLVGVRRRWLILVGALGVVGFVIVARPEPSVLRAAAMGVVALVGTSLGTRQGVRSLGAAVLVLVLFSPWLALTWGFALSVCATAGILFLAPRWRQALSAWLPHWLAEAIVVPLAAQIACTPLVAALSGQVSLVAIAANALAAPAVGPATVLGMSAGVAGLIWAPAGHLLGSLAAWGARWIIAVAHWSAALPNPSVQWPESPVWLVVLTMLCVLAAVLAPRVLTRWRLAVLVALIGGLLVLVPWTPPGWPGKDWVMVMCDVGQGDGLVLNTGGGTGVVVDVGPDPTLMDRCLRRLGIDHVPMVVLTHFHLDHVGGLAGVLSGRSVGAIEVPDLAAPAAQVDSVRRIAAQHEIPIRVGGYLERVEVGEIQWQVVAPSGEPPGDTDSPPNDASLVLLVHTRGVSMLLMADEEQPSQRRLHQELPALHADVLKVAHHGSARQDPDLIGGLGARLAMISVGEDNDYGHPADSTLRLLRKWGMMVKRTSIDGDIVVSVDSGGHLRVRSSR